VFDVCAKEVRSALTGGKGESEAVENLREFRFIETVYRLGTQDDHHARCMLDSWSAVREARISKLERVIRGQNESLPFPFPSFTGQPIHRNQLLSLSLFITITLPAIFRASRHSHRLESSQ